MHNCYHLMVLGLKITNSNFSLENAYILTNFQLYL